MLAYCTYCSANKHYSEIKVSAIQLYDSTRITEVFEAATKANIAFVILSGKYGIIEADEQISYYDHLLLPSEVENHASLLASQILSKHITKIQFYTNSIERDKNLKAYIDCIIKACAKSSTKLNIVEKYFDD
ncbi:MAG: hypothetical protein MK212_06645 [Saprospiraceae bacterium]|nr:hypothetical protein [Saprospiraceae bacterium]